MAHWRSARNRELLAGQGRWVGVPLVGPDVDIGLELLDHEARHDFSVLGDARRVFLTRFASDPR